jgi:hypothetical protein
MQIQRRRDPQPSTNDEYNYERGFTFAHHAFPPGGTVTKRPRRERYACCTDGEGDASDALRSVSCSSLYERKGAR